ncbi:hypothetical protein CIB84_012894 [Bambusicola thoracicus]|uniref:Uncharacterized protein n=1 Tax=Bambusicola thoracicus TaxID=9083 RepID=A0A2P4SGY6_BAMTH|nr:hypothetical protein CIB84_012894 [Bambusicola thoracicus]
MKFISTTFPTHHYGRRQLRALH